MQYFNRLKLTLILSVLSFLFMDITAMAQGSAGKLLEEVIVTAQKREQNIQEVPISILAFSGDKLETQGIGDIGDLNIAAPGLSIFDGGGGGQHAIFLRGMANIRGTSSLVGVYLDEASVTGSVLGQLDLQLHDLERVEILRGPQGTLYGAGSMGGTVRFITNDPQLDQVGGKVDISAAFTDDGDPGQEVRGVINVPLINNELGIRIAATYKNSGGWMDQPAVSRSNINDQELVNVRIKTLWEPNDALRVNATAVIHRNNAGADIGEDSDGNFVQGFIAPTTTPTAENDYEVYNLTFTYDFGAVQLLSTTSYTDNRRRVNDRGYRLPFLGPPTVAPLFEVYVNERQEETTFSQEARLSSNGEGPLSWTIGGFYRDAEVSDDAPFLFGIPPGPAISLPVLNEDRSEAWAVFGEATYAFSERLEIGAGIRYFEDDREADDFTANLSQTGSFNSTNPRAFIRYALTDDINAYASVAKGFRSGGLSGTLGADSFDPDFVWTYELGTKMSLLDNRLNAELALFYSDYNDYQQAGFVLVGTTLTQVTTNIGDVDIKGVDWNLSWHASDQLTLGFGGSYVDTEFDKVNPGVSNIPLNVGDPINFIPEYQYNVWATYDFDWFDQSSGFIRVDYNQQGRAHGRDRSFGPWYRSMSDVINMLNTRIGWKRDQWSIEVFASNLLDDRDNITAEEHEQFHVRSRPRTFGIQVGMDF